LCHKKIPRLARAAGFFVAGGKARPETERLFVTNFLAQPAANQQFGPGYEQSPALRSYGMQEKLP